MKYRTTIEIVSEARDKNEAIEIVGEYLSGNINSGVNMKCLTDPVQSAARIAVTTLLFVALLGGSIFSALYTKPGMMATPVAPGTSAIQPPLKTSVSPDHKKSEAFKKAWEAAQVKEALRFSK